MIPLLRLAARRHMTQHSAQTMLCILGVALGVAVALATRLATESSRRGFGLTVDTLSGGATHTILGGPRGVPTDVLRFVQVELGVPHAAPIVDGDVQLYGPGGSKETYRVFGLDPYVDGPFRPFDGSRLGTPLPLDRFMGESGAVVLPMQAAQTLGAGVGDTVSGVCGGHPIDLPVVAVMNPSDPALARALDRVLITDVSSAQEILRRPDTLSRIDLLLSPAEAASLEPRLPLGVRLVQAENPSASLDRMTEAFRLNIECLGLLALVVGGFLIYGTMTFSVVRRRPWFGRLRALGVSRSEILNLVLWEAALVGVLGSSLGVLMGWFLARSLVQVVSSTITDLYFAVAVQVPVPSGWVIAGSFALGLVATLVAAWIPAREASKSDPAQEMLRSSADLAARAKLGRRILLALLFAGLGLGFLSWPTQSLLPCYAGLLCGVLAFAALSTPLAFSVATVAGPLLGGLFGIRGRLAAGGVTTGLSRTGVAVAGLAVALSMALGVETMIQSFRGVVGTWLDQTLRADVYVSVPSGVARATTENPMDAQIVADLKSLASIERIMTNRTVPMASDAGDFMLVACGGAPLSGFGPPLLEGDAASIDRPPDDVPSILVSEPLAHRMGLRVGQTLRLETAHGRRPFHIRGVFRDFASDRGYAVISSNDYQDAFQDPEINAVALFTKPGLSAEALAAEVRQVTGGRQDLLVRAQSDLRAASLLIFDRTFRITGVLRVLALIVAIIGFVSSLLSLQLERRQEMAALRARGLTVREMGGLVVGQTLILGLAAGVAALPLGTVFAAILTFELNPRSFGWSLPLHLSPSSMMEIVLWAAAASVVAGIPAIVHLARTRPAMALRETNP